MMYYCVVCHTLHRVGEGCCADSMEDRDSDYSLGCIQVPEEGLESFGFRPTNNA